MWCRRSSSDPSGEDETSCFFQRHIHGFYSGARYDNGVTAKLVAHGQIDRDLILTSDLFGKIGEIFSGDKTD